MKTKIAIIGLGVISKFYINALKSSKDFELTAVCDLTPEKLLPFFSGGIQITTNYKDILENKKIEAVIVNLPNDLHYKVCSEILQSGKHVCCEKPLALSANEAANLVEFAQQAHLVLFTAFHRRYNINLQKFLTSAESKKPIRKIVAHYLEDIVEHAGNDTWYLSAERSGGGCIADNGPNVFDTLVYSFGDIKVRQANITKKHGDVDKHAEIKGETLAGVPFEVELDWSYPHGERKDIVLHYMSGEMAVIDLLNGFEQFKSSLWHEYEEVLKDFAAAIMNGTPRGMEGLRICELVEDAYQIALGIKEAA